MLTYESSQSLKIQDHSQVTRNKQGQRIPMWHYIYIYNMHTHKLNNVDCYTLIPYYNLSR